MRETPSGTRSDEEVKARIARERLHQGASCPYPRCGTVDGASLGYGSVRTHLADFVASRPQPVSTEDAAEHVGISAAQASSHLGCTKRASKIDKGLWTATPRELDYETERETQQQNERARELAMERRRAKRGGWLR
jgi:hypothetical protein